MIELKDKAQLEKAIARAKADARNLVVRTTSAVRMYRVENRSNGNIYTVNFFLRGDGKRFAHCSCKAGLQNIACKHLAAAAGLNTYLAANGGLKNRKTISNKA